MKRDFLGQALVDGCGRTVEYLRLSVTDRCDLRCSYCLPKGFRDFTEPADWLAPEEIARVVGVFARLGVSRVRLTGGEPLTRKRIVDIAAGIAATPAIADLSLSTNATRLATMAGDLRTAGVARLNVSLDTLDRAEYARLTGKDCLDQVLAGLSAASEAGFKLVKINMVALPGLTVEAVEAMIDFCMARGFILRLIEAMPMGDAGRGAGFLSLASIEKALLERHPLRAALVPGGGPARYLRHDDNPRFTIGFITPRSQHFCSTCNRVRMTVDGSLHLCLGHEERFDLRDMMRDGSSDDEIAAAIAAALQRKPARHEFDAAPWRTIRVMAATGG
jgi:cyclic pyranopterin phosphate synthase